MNRENMLHLCCYFHSAIFAQWLLAWKHTYIHTNTIYTYICTHIYVRVYRLFGHAAVIVIVCCHWLFAICFCCLLVVFCKCQDSFKKMPELIAPRHLMWFVYVVDQPLYIVDPINNKFCAHKHLHIQVCMYICMYTMEALILINRSGSLILCV